MTERVTSEELVKAVRYLHAQGWAPATSSNYSYRDAATIWISKSGIDKGEFAAEHLMAIDLPGRALADPSAKASAETGLHCMLYAWNDAIRCVLHTHSPKGTVVSRLLADAGAFAVSGYELEKGFAGVTSHEAEIVTPIFANSQDIASLAEEVQRYLQEHREAKGFLIAGHGLYTWGASVAEAKRHVEVYEFLFDCWLLERHHHVAT